MKKLFSLFLIICSALTVPAQVKLPRLVRDSMILQRDAPINIWGWAGKNEKVKIQFNNKNYKTTANTDGKWKVILPAMKAGGPYSMDITASNKISLKEILVGDVWICSGQSNMVLPMVRVADKYADEIKQVDYPQIRHFFIPTLTNLQQAQEDLPTGFWKAATSPDILQFSATAYFFAKTLYEKYHVPIGLINASVGGSPVEAWTSEEGLKSFPDVKSIIDKNKDTGFVNRTNREALEANMPYSQRGKQDKGLSSTPTWYDPAYVPKEWHPIYVPGYWEDQGIKDLDGVVWFRKEIDVPASMTNVEAKLYMGRVVDADFMYINGQQVGNITYQYPPRRYMIPPGVLKPGKNIITIRILNYQGKGGFVPGKAYYLSAANQTIDLFGQWQYKVGEVFAPTPRLPQAIDPIHQPTALFNTMIAPLIPYTIKGFVWYQGEANAGEPSTYQEHFAALIADWRNRWKQGPLPFIYAQLPNFNEINYLPSESNWALLREAQLKTLAIPNTGMAVTIDLGEWNDIHPLNKKDVGYRLALVAKKVAYGETDEVDCSPMYHSSQTEGNKIVISFNNIGSGLISNDGEELAQFAIAGADKKFVWAKARIEGTNVIVWSDNVSKPMYVRYAWADNPENPNLYNKEGLPASPFRTDQ